MSVAGTKNFDQPPHDSNRTHLVFSTSGLLLGSRAPLVCLGKKQTLNIFWIIFLKRLAYCCRLIGTNRTKNGYAWLQENLMEPSGCICSPRRVKAELERARHSCIGIFKKGFFNRFDVGLEVDVLLYGSMNYARMLVCMFMLMVLVHSPAFIPFFLEFGKGWYVNVL